MSKRRAPTGASAATSNILINVLIGLVAVFHVLVFVAYYQWRVSAPTSILGSDLRAFYTSWQMVHDGHASKLYDLGVQIRTQSAIMGRPMTTDNLLAFVNPPYVSLGLSWLAFLDVRTAYAAFSALQLVCLGLACRMMLRGEMVAWSRRAQVLFLTSGVLSIATLSAITLGTFTPTMLLALVGLAAEYRRSIRLPAAEVPLRHWRAAGWLCVLTIKPQLAVFVLVALIATRQWKVIRNSAVIGTVVVVATSVVCGPGIWARYAEFLRTYGSSNGKFGGDSHYMWNVRGMLTRMDGVSTPTADRLANGLFLIGVVAFGVWVARVWSTTAAANRPLLFERTVALTLALTVLLVPHCNRQDMLLLLPGVVALHNLRRERASAPGRPGRRIDWFVVVGCLLSAVALTWDNNPYGYAVHPLTLLGLVTLGLAMRIRAENEPVTTAGAGNVVGL